MLSWDGSKATLHHDGFLPQAHQCNLACVSTYLCMLFKLTFLKISPSYIQKHRSIKCIIKEGLVSIDSEIFELKCIPAMFVGPCNSQQAAHYGLAQAWHRPPNRSVPKHQNVMVKLYFLSISSRYYCWV